MGNFEGFIKTNHKITKNSVTTAHNNSILAQNSNPVNIFSTFFILRRATMSARPALVRKLKFHAYE